MNIADVIEIVLVLARRNDLTPDQIETCNILEDFAINHLGDE